MNSKLNIISDMWTDYFQPGLQMSLGSLQPRSRPTAQPLGYCDYLTEIWPPQFPSAYFWVAILSGFVAPIPLSCAHAKKPQLDIRPHRYYIAHAKNPQLDIWPHRYYIAHEVPSCADRTLILYRARGRAPPRCSYLHLGVPSLGYCDIAFLAVCGILWLSCRNRHTDLKKASEEIWILILYDNK